MKKSFEEKVRSMTAAQIIRAMIRGLKKQHVKVDMDSFGERRGNTCFGCAATNTVCEIYGKEIKRPIFGRNSYERTFTDLAEVVNADETFVRRFENAIDYLRKGCVGIYNLSAADIGIAKIYAPDFSLPALRTKNYREHLPAYEKLARLQPKTEAK